MNIPEKNKRIAELVYLDEDLWVGMPNANGSIPIAKADSKYPDFVVDYYSSWNDLMPLVLEYGISNMHNSDSKDWDIFDNHNTTFLLNTDNPQHALADCLLKVLEERSK